jgi:thioredoxin-related protein
MRLITTILGCFLIFSSMQSLSALELGSQMPNLAQKMKSVDGKFYTLNALKSSKGKLVIFSCNACPYVKAWESRTVALANKYMAKGFAVIQINSNDPRRVSEDSYSKMKMRAKERGMKFPYVVDSTSDVARAFDATRTPEFFLFDQNNKLIYTGALDSNSGDASKVSSKDMYLKNALEAHLAGKPISKNKTKSIGCGIKFRKI